MEKHKSGSNYPCVAKLSDNLAKKYLVEMGNREDHTKDEVSRRSGGEQESQNI